MDETLLKSIREVVERAEMRLKELIASGKLSEKEQKKAQRELNKWLAIKPEWNQDDQKASN